MCVLRENVIEQTRRNVEKIMSTITVVTTKRIRLCLARTMEEATLHKITFSVSI